MVLQKGHERCRLEIKGRGAAPLLLPRIALPLVEIAPLESRNKFLRCPLIVGVIGRTMPSERHHRTVVEIIVPEGVETISAALWRADQFGMLWFVFSHQEGSTSMGRSPHAVGNGQKNMVCGSVINVLGGIQAQAVEVKFPDPVAGIGKEKLAHRTGMLVCIVNGLSPVRGVAIGKILWGKLRQKIAVCSQVVVNH